MSMAIQANVKEGFADRLRQAARPRMTEQERLEQTISYIYGSVDEEIGITKDQIREYLREDKGQKS